MPENTDKLYDDITKQLEYISNEDAHKKLARILGKQYVDYRKKWVESGKCQDNLNYPLHLNIILNDSCNLKCVNCVYSIEPEKRNYKLAKGTISKELFKTLVADGYKNGLCSIEMAGLNEPTIIKDIADYYKIAKSCGIIDLMMTTNANLLTKKMSRELIESGLTWIAFSLDAFTEETYKKTRIGGNFNKVVQNILDFIEIKKEMNSELPLIRVSFLKMKHNIHEYNDFLNFWKDKVDVIAVQKLINTHKGYDDENEFEDNLQISTEDSPCTKMCPSPYQRLVIRNNGDVLPCCSFFGYNLVVGNIYKNSLYDIWNNKEYKILRERINSQDMSKKPKPCQLCVNGREIGK